LYAELQDYAKAVQFYELVADASLSSALTKYSVKEYWLRAGLCAVAEGVSAQFTSFRPYFARIGHNIYLLSLLVLTLTWSFLTPHPSRQDIVKARRQASTYASKDVTFTSTREHKFLIAVIDARESEDEQALTDAAVDFDSVVKLDNWKTKVLLDIKNKIQESGGDFR